MNSVSDTVVFKRFLRSIWGSTSSILHEFLDEHHGSSGLCGVFALGGYLVIKGRTEIGTVVAFVSGLAKINDPWGAVVDWYQSLKVAQVKYGLIRASLR